MLAFVSYPRTTKRISWRKLDQFEDCDLLAYFLNSLGIRGTPGDPNDCPLALATGDIVYEKVRRHLRLRHIGWKVRGHLRRIGWIAWEVETRLTPTQRAFVKRYDKHRYLYLELPKPARN